MSRSGVYDINDTGSWFASPFYSILYGKRDEKEAQDFVGMIMQYLDLPSGAIVLDAACGTGRYSRALAAHDLKVVGLDISADNIEIAEHDPNDSIHFEVRDLKNSCGEKKYDLACSFFTSLGFDANTDQVITNLSKALKPEGLLLIDFMNVLKVKRNLVASEQKEIKGVSFSIQRFFKDGFLCKHIHCTEEHLVFEEKVQALSLADFKRYFKQADLSLVETFGDYELGSFDENTSDRLILLAKTRI